jgi:hypothetical protein
MGTRNFQFFMSLEQLVEQLSFLEDKLNLWFVLFRYGNPQRLTFVEKLPQCSTAEISSYDGLYISPTKPVAEQIDANKLIPAKLGWLDLKLPKQQDNVLFLADMGMKSEWYDRDEGVIYENKDLGQRHDKLKRALRKHLFSPMYIKNIKYGGSGEINRIYYSTSAREWEENGGELMQEGVYNLRFSTRPYPPSKK